MSRLFIKLRSISARKYAFLAILAGVIAIPAALWAWGPDRTTYTIEKPATKVVFNSITNNPHLGDERNFVTIREKGTDGAWLDNQKVARGKEYIVRMYVHNNAAANLNLVANNVTAKFYLPTNTATSLQVNGFLSASNATPQQVYDHAVFSGDENFNLALVPGSIKYHNNAGVFDISQSVFTSAGAKLGYQKMDGNIPGCFQYAGYLTFTVRPQFAPVAAKHDFTMKKMVSKHGENKWVENYEAQPGETVDFLLTYKNTGNAQQDNVTFRDKLPAHLSYVAGSAVYGNSKFPKGTKATDDVTGAGVNVGSYAPGANAWLIFSAKVDNKESLTCGTNTLRNVAAVIPGTVGQKEDDATVTVTKKCDTPKPTPVYTCNALTINKIARDEFSFSVKYSHANGANYKSSVFKVYDKDGKEVYSSENGNFKGFPAGSYTVKAFVTFTVNGDSKTVTSAACEQRFTIDPAPTPEPKKIDVCRLSDKKYPVTINERDFDSKLYSKNPNDCKEAPKPEKITVCIITTGVITKIDKNEFTTEKHSTDLRQCEKMTVCEFTTGTITTIRKNEFDKSKHGDESQCDKVQICIINEKRIDTISRKDISSEKHTEDLSKCAKAPQPVAVTELPKTGADLLVGGLGMGMLFTAGAAYIASRRVIG